MKKTSLCVIGILLSGCGALSSIFRSDNGGSGCNNNCEKHIKFWSKCVVAQMTDKWTCLELSNLSLDLDTAIKELANMDAQCISTMNSSSDFDYEFLRACGEKDPENSSRIYNSTLDREMRSQCPNIEQFRII